MDKFGNNEILKDYTSCLWTNMHIIDGGTGKLQFHVFMDFFESLDQHVQIIFIIMSKNCFTGSISDLEPREKIYSVVLCMKRNDPVVSGHTKFAIFVATAIKCLLFFFQHFLTFDRDRNGNRYIWTSWIYPGYTHLYIIWVKPNESFEFKQHVFLFLFIILPSNNIN